MVVPQRVIGILLAGLLSSTACVSSSRASVPGSAPVSVTDRAATSAPAIVPMGAGGYEVFYRGWDGSLFSRTVVNGFWSTATPLGGRIVGPPAAAVIGSDVVLVVRSPYNGLRVRIRTAGNWSGWYGLGKTVTAAPAVTAWRNGRVDVFARGPDDLLYTRTLNRTTATTSWQRLSTTGVATGPAAVATGLGKLTVLVTGVGGSVLRRTLDGGAWSNWNSLGGVTYNAPAVAAVPGTTTVLALMRGTNGQLYSQRLPGRGWRAQGGHLIDAPAVAAGAGAEDLVVVRGWYTGYQSRTYRNDVWSSYRLAWRPTAAPAPPPSLLGIDVTRIPTAHKIIALTFDAGANADGLASIRRTLQLKNAAATFFLTGAWTRLFPALASEVALSGFTIGNHSDNHPPFPQLSDAQVTGEVRTAQTAILRGTGVDPSPLFRFPYGDVNARVLKDVNQLGYIAVRWTIDTLGWEGTSGGMTVQRVIERVVTGATSGAIVLMHVGSNPDDHTTLDAQALPTIIDRLVALGYQLVSLSALTG